MYLQTNFNSLSSTDVINNEFYIPFRQQRRISSSSIKDETVTIRYEIMTIDLEALRAQLKQLLLKHNLPTEQESEPEPEQEPKLESSLTEPQTYDAQDFINQNNDNGHRDTQNQVEKKENKNQSEGFDKESSRESVLSHNNISETKSLTKEMPSQCESNSQLVPDESKLQNSESPQKSETTETTETTLFQGLLTENEKTRENDVNIETNNEQKLDSSEMNERENKSKRLQECRTLLNHLEEQLTKACEREDYETAGLFLFHCKSIESSLSLCDSLLSVIR
jgi:hypothetical protein